MVVLYLKLCIKDLYKSSHQLFFESDLLLCAVSMLRNNNIIYFLI